MKLYDLGITALIIALAAFGIGAWAHVKLGTGNPITKAEDAVIEAETGIPIDIDALVEEGEEVINSIKPGIIPPAKTPAKAV